MMRKLRDLQTQVDERSSDVARKESQMHMLEAEKESAIKRLRDAEGEIYQQYKIKDGNSSHFSSAPSSQFNSNEKTIAQRNNLLPHAHTHTHTQTYIYILSKGTMLFHLFGYYCTYKFIHSIYILEYITPSHQSNWKLRLAFFFISNQQKAMFNKMLTLSPILCQLFPRVSRSREASIGE